VSERQILAGGGFTLMPGPRALFSHALTLAAANALLVVPPDKKHYQAGSTMSALPLRDYPFELAELAL